MNPRARPGGHFAPGGMFASGGHFASTSPPPSTPAPEPPPEAVRAALDAAASAVAASRGREGGAADAGEVLAAIARADGEIRVSVHWYTAAPGATPRPWVRVALWREGWPVKGKGVALRAGELASIVVALGAALARVRDTPPRVG